jgi:NAD(P)-dependent dehydrogenase (short-subunit alcohol dehydrogenase family)
MRRNLQDMVVVITGASAGIGKALAEALHARGARLALAARRLDRISELVSRLGSDRHIAVQTDVSDQAQCESLVAKTLDRFGGLDTLVCNAGYGVLRPVADTPADEIMQMFRTNVFGTTDCIRAAVPHMRRRQISGGYRGQVMIVSSVVARRGLPFYGVYSATKAAQLSLAEAMRVELKSDAIAVTSVHPIGTDSVFGDAARRAAKHNRGIKQLPHEVRQSAETVARKMVDAIEAPRPEVWPFGPSRIAVSVGTLIPGLVDRVMSKRVAVEEVPTPPE